MARERPDHTLQPTALVSEAYLKLCKQGNPRRSESYGFSGGCGADHPPGADRSRQGKAGTKTRRRPGGISLSDADPAANEPPIDLLDLDVALEKLEQRSSRMYQVVVCRYFAGMTMGEIAESLHVGHARSRRIGHSPRPGCEGNWRGKSSRIHAVEWGD